MTAQSPEMLILDGQTHAVCAEPLARYLRSAGVDRIFRATNSACWRGYIGTWEVIDDRLYLAAIEGNLESGEMANLETIFPNTTGPVFAHWYSGVLRIPQGEMFNYVHGGYESFFEKNLLLEFEAGLLISRHIKANKIEHGKGVQTKPSWPGSSVP